MGSEDFGGDFHRPMPEGIVETIADLPPEIRECLAGLDVPFRDDQISPLKATLREYGDSIARAAKTAPFIDVALALQLRKSAQDILDRYEELDSESRKAGSAAVKYFLMRDDAQNGFLKPGGFEDDAMVLRAATSFIAARESGRVGRTWAA